ncbi:MAG: glycosyltransferase, partial [Clostridia bacterium]|nr:glycosyltransferase [Clostridia bacterium]
YYRRANRNVYWIPNPHGEMASKHPAGTRTGNRVVWCGRLSSEKDPISAVKAFSLVREAMPEAQMTLVGGSNSGEWYTKIVEQEIERLNLRESITMTGMVHDIEKYYGQADVLICTSEYEGFCLTLMEAAEFSLPIITFDMPYLEILRRVPDIIRVPQKDVKALAGKIVEVLRDDEKRTRLGSGIREKMAEIREMNLTDQWQTVLKSIEEGTEKTEQELMDSESSEILINTMLLQYAEGAAFKERQICAMEQSRQETEKELERKNREAELLSRKLKETEARDETMRQECKYWEEKAKLYEHSLSFRVGRVMTKPMRLLRGFFNAGGQ